MRRGYNIEFQYNSIKTLLEKNYGFDTSIIDLISMIDTSLTVGENWEIIRTRLLI